MGQVDMKLNSQPQNVMLRHKIYCPDSSGKHNIFYCAVFLASSSQYKSAFRTWRLSVDFS